MKKIILVLSLSIILATGLFSMSYASTSVTERSDIKISINGTVGTYTSTPIIVNGSTLLPLRELFVNLGVANDDTHIIWNNTTHSVKVIKDSTEMELTVGDAKATVNKKAVTITTPPVNYNARVYIPARFVAEAFGMDVTWDNTTKTVAINGKTELKSTDKKFSVTLPSGWSQASDLNDEADLQAQSEGENAYMVALMEPKADLSSFAEWNKAVLDPLKTTYTNVTLSQPTNVTVNGNPAIQYVLTGTYDNVNVKMLLTYVQGPTYYAQILCWSTISTYDTYANDFTPLLNSITGL